MAKTSPFESTLLGTVVLSDATTIKVNRNVNTRNKVESIDIRKFFTPAGGEEVATSKGISINSESLPDVLKIVLSGLSSEEKIDLLSILDDIE